jgi:hypothetical protein
VLRGTWFHESRDFPSREIGEGLCGWRGILHGVSPVRSLRCRKARACGPPDAGTRKKTKKPAGWGGLSRDLAGAVRGRRTNPQPAPPPADMAGFCPKVARTEAVR